MCNKRIFKFGENGEKATFKEALKHYNDTLMKYKMAVLETVLLADQVKKMEVELWFMKKKQNWQDIPQTGIRSKPKVWYAYESKFTHCKKRG